MCVAFAAAHWNQGLKSGITILLIAVVLHALVAINGTLLVAMLVHGAYDFIVGLQIRRQALLYDLDPMTSLSE